MVAQVVFSEYVPEWFNKDNKSVQTNVVFKLGDDLEKKESEYFSDENDTNEENLRVVLPKIDDIEEITENRIIDDIQIVQSVEKFETQNTNNLPDFEEINTQVIAVNPYLRTEQLRSSGFLTAIIEEEINDEMLYRTVYIGDIDSVIKKRYLLRDDALLYARVYVFSPDAGNSPDIIYNSLKNKASNASNSSINETNQFGKASFYMNDTIRPETAFLTVKFSSLVYSFSYPKVYHKQVVNLITLISFEK